MTNVSITHGDFRQKSPADGANGAIGGLAQGGAIEGLHASLTLRDSYVVQNYSTGGNGAATQGAAGGGGLTLGNITNSDSIVTLVNNLIANNEVRAGTGAIAGGGGGGIWLKIRALLEHNTIAQNRLLTQPLQGAALIALNDGAGGSATSAVVTMNYNIIAEHDVDAANNVDGTRRSLSRPAQSPDCPRNRIELRLNLLADNSQNFNTFNVGTFAGADTSILADGPGFISSGTPNLDYEIGFLSAAVNAATGSSDADDIDGDGRVGVPDIGAWEAAPFSVVVFPIGNGVLRVEWGNNAGVDSYDMTVNCPSSGSAPNEVDCGATTSYPGSATGATLTGLTNGLSYSVAVAPIVVNRVAVPPTTVSATPTDIFVMLPAVSR